jgi:hypothetical protein
MWWKRRNSAVAGKNSICSKCERLRHWCYCIIMPPKNQSSNCLKSVKAPEKIEVEKSCVLIQ